MASVHLDQNGDCFDSTDVEKIIPQECDDFGEAEISSQIPSDSYDAVDIFGEPEIQPRIGDAYQVELPPLITESDYMAQCVDAEIGAQTHQNFLVGLPILVTWIGDMKNGILVSCSSSTTSSDFTHSESENVIKNKISLGEIEPSQDSRKFVDEWQNLPTANKICKFSGSGCFLAPGLVGDCWSASEKDSFLLGLYIFEKHFVEVRRFIGTKEMGSLLSFYYGQFYGSQEYRRWSECRKMKGKKYILGQRMFSGQRQQELLSRILPKVSDECRTVLLEVSKTFADEKMSLSEYVSSLKAMVGLKILVEVFGIGTGKQDLTGMALEPSRSNQVIPMRPEIPTGKACSSLTTSEIIKFLSGDYRLSKARSNDLFWEAVWPRLLARGWNSEQPKDQICYTGSKHCLVFLIPGVKKFSRRKLVKGDHYFDSVTDVLNKVAREPGLIELDTEEDDGSKNKGEGDGSNGKRSEQDDDDDDLPARQRHSYLQPRTPNRNSAVLKFTVVDTSLSDGKIRELKTLPSDYANAFIVQNHTEDSDEDTSEGSSDESDTINKITVDASATDKLTLKTSKSDEKLLPGRKDHNVSALYQDTQIVHPRTSAKLVPDLKIKNRARGNNQSRKVSKPQLSRKLKQGNVDYMAAPITKHGEILTACSQETTNASLLPSWTAPRLENGMPSCCSYMNEVTENLSYQVGLCQDKLSSTSSLRGSPGESIENPQTQALIDLNVPQVSPDSENGVFTTGLCKEQDSTSVKQDDHCSQKSAIEVKPEQPPNLNPVRHSTRNRPPTSRALEALANGYLTVNRKRKGKDIKSKDPASRPSQRARGVARPNDSNSNSAASHSSSVASHVEEAENDVSNIGNCIVFNKSLVPAKANEGSVSGQ